MNVLGRSRLLLLLAPLVLAACPETDPDSYPGPPVPCVDFSTPQSYVDALKCTDYQSCELSCTCGEPSQPYQCPAMQPWAAMVHADCMGFDGSTFPDVTQGKCTSSAPTGQALESIGLDSTVANRWHLPDGHFIQPAGHDQIVHGSDVKSAFLVDEILIPQTSYAVLVDAGAEDNALYTVDLDLLAQDAPAMVSEVKLSAGGGDSIDYGMAFVAPNEIYVSGAGAAKIYAFTIDTTSGALARDAQNDVSLGVPGLFYAGGLATTGDPNVLVVAPGAGSSQALVVNLSAKTTTPIDFSPAQQFFGVFADPNDAAGHTFWLTEYDARHLVRFDSSQGAITAAYPTGKNPEGVVITPTNVIVANSDDDTISVFDQTGKLDQTLSTRSDGLPGPSPGVLAFDPNLSRVYATLAGINAIDVYAYNPTATAPLASLGRIPTSWWPTALKLRDDGSLVVATAKGHGTGPSSGTASVEDLTKGSVALIAPPALSDLDAMSDTVVASRQTSSGFPTVTCPPRTYDFPIPLTNTVGPSGDIQYVVWIVRESKSFDGVFGDLSGVNGDAQDVLYPNRMNELWANTRALAEQFTNFDDYGAASESAIQGHVWTAYGRSTDYVERSWSSTARGARFRAQGINATYGSPGEGSLFIWGDKNAIDYQDMGEIVGIGANSIDPNFPGVLESLATPDTEKACYFAARARATCDLASLTYMLLPNDATFGSAAGLPSPDIMIAANDVATGIVVDAISHSPYWPNALVIVTEDDAAMGEDHVDAHRTPLIMISPWVKHGYVSHTKIGTSAIHKLLANLFGAPYQSEEVLDAAIPYDAFTSTPDYTSYSFSPLTTDVSCNPTQQ